MKMDFARQQSSIGPNLTKQQLAIIATFIRNKSFDAENALTAHDAILKTCCWNPGLFSNLNPSSSTAAARMTKLYNDAFDLHRVPREGSNGYKYFFNSQNPHAIPPPKVKEKPSASYELLKRPDGSIAGVAKDGILYETLETLLQSLNENC